MSIRKKIALLFYNFLVVFIVITAVISIYMGSSGALSNNKLEAFKYFTVQSNIFVGITALASIIFILKDNEIPRWLTYIKLTSATSVMVTFSVVVAYLAPVIGFALLYQGANFLMHLVIPLLAFFEFIIIIPKKELRFKFNLFSLLPVTIYGIFYISNIVIHNGYGVPAYDWYQLGTQGIGAGLLSYIIILSSSFLLSALMSFLHKILAK